MHPEQIILEPLITEKSTRERAFFRYVFKVHPRSTKIDIKLAVEKLFKVRVIDVNTCNIRPKRRVRGQVVGRTAHGKKAYVTLASGQKIEELEV